MARVFVFILLLTLPMQAFGNCTFVTAQYSKEMQDPGSVKKIDIEIKKSKKWATNGLKMILDDREFIHPKWKKKFKADITVSYAFGKCTYAGKVRQNGDWRDHQEFKNGELLQSLDVGLSNGNIANVVDFKLFLPRTRNGNNETLATLIFRKMGVMAPKTFTIDVAVNGIEGVYLFQEKEAKELLESMGRREGPIFKGDEALLWSFEGFSPMTLLPVSGVKLVNHKWARRGEASTQMALSAYLELQRQFVIYASHTKDRNRFFLDPNNRLPSSKTIPEYHALVIAFGGWHGLFGLNRKFYWNALAGKFEPIYYDGNVSFETLSISGTMGQRPVEEELFRNNFSKTDFKSLSSRVMDMGDDDFIDEFAVLAKLSPDEARSFVRPKLSQIVSNLAVLQEFAAESPEDISWKMDYEEGLGLLLEANETFGLAQRFVALEDEMNSGGYHFDCLQVSECQDSDVSLDQVIDLMASQQFGSARYVALPKVNSSVSSTPYKVSRAGPISIVHTNTGTVEYDKELAQVRLFQEHADDWFLIKDQRIKDISVTLVGPVPELNTDSEAQRFNKFGLTGCLTFYNSVFENASIEVVNGGCEDSLNIVTGTGVISSIQIANSLSDAIDFDFSRLEIGSVTVAAAGNDCVDVSGGYYIFGDVELTNCGDKGVSVGEQSTVFSESVMVDMANIGVSSKDYSNMKINKLSVDNLSVCIEAFQKKEEFGGGTIDIADENCERGKIAYDKNSVIVLGGTRLELQD